MKNRRHFLQKSIGRKKISLLLACLMLLATLAACAGDAKKGSEESSSSTKTVTSSSEETTSSEQEPSSQESEAKSSESIIAEVEGGDFATESAVDMGPPNQMPIIIDEPIIHNTESYAHLDENPFYLVEKAPLSTFAADVDTASYANIRRFLRQGELPQKDAVRIEEMLNYFSYNYPEPTGDDPFSVTMELGQTPWNPDTKLLLVGLQAEDPAANNRPPSNLVFLIDVSGSMHGPDRLDLVKRAYLTMLDQLGPEDKISIVTYASVDEVVIEGASLDNKAEIMTAIENLDAGGSTHGSAGINTAYEIAEKYFIEDGNNRIILATDGDLNVGVTSEGELIDLIEDKKETGTFLSVLAFGYGNYKDDKLEAIANHGNGHLSYIDDIFEARKVLSDELGSTLFTVAKDVKLQVDFNPAYVKGYRLIGYENRVMAAEDFADDTKDGGEIGSGHSVTALYEIVDVDSDFEIPSVDSKYTTPDESTETENTSDFNDEMLTLNIRYKEPDGDTSELLTYPLVADEADEPSDNFLLAASLAEFGMLLKDSEFKGSTDYNLILSSLEDLASDDPYVVELLELVEIAQDLPPRYDSGE